MRKNILFLSSIFSLLIMAACSVIPTVPPSQPISPTATTPNGMPISFGNVSLVIPTGLAGGASFATSVDVEYPYINPSFGDMPEHTVITLNGYSLQGGIPRILIFPADHYSQYTELTQKIIAALQAFPVQSSDQVPADLATTFFAQTKRLANGNATGLRYLTEVLTGVAPINNKDIFYYYQGLTSDGKYFIQAVIPVNADFLVADSNPSSVIPADGIPFPFDTLSDANATQNYYNAVQVKLNSTDLSAFTPSLSLLDELIQSIHVSP